MENQKSNFKYSQLIQFIIRSNNFYRAIFFVVFCVVIATILCFSRDKEQVNVVPTSNRDEYPNRLLNITDFKYSIGKTDCLMQNANSDWMPQFVILVHSGPTNFHRRLVIRETWGQERSVAKPKVYFLLGETKSTATQKLIEIENDRYQDLIQGNFIDVYRNLTYKHTMALKWFNDNCDGMDFLIKTDDDVFVNVPPLFDYLNLLGRSDVIACSVFWDANRLNYSKWAVTPEEYPHAKYPPYCQGIAIVYSRGSVERLYRQAQITRYFWIDDVQITGVVREKCNVTLVDWDDQIRLTDDKVDRLRKNTADWADDSNFLFYLLNREDDLSFLWYGTRRFRTLTAEDE